MMASDKVNSNNQRKFRDSYERFFAPYGRFLARIGITPNVISLVAILLAFCAGLSFALRYFYLGVFLLIASSLADMLDGSTARALGTDSPFGMVIDHTLDRYAEYFYFAGIMLAGSDIIDPSIVMFTIVGMFMASYIRAKAESVGKVSISVSGIIERKEKITIVGFGAFFQGVYMDGILDFNSLWDAVIASWLPIGPLTVALLIVGILSHITAIQRFLYARKVMSTTSNDKKGEK